MSDERALAAALAEAGLRGPATDVAALSGGCMHRVVGFRAGGRHLVAKTDDAARLGLFEEEARSLSALAATGTVRGPEVLALGAWEGRAVLLMKRLPAAPADAAAWGAFGRELAALHAADAGPRYGFDVDNHLGLTPQPNAWCDDWVEFVGMHRLAWQAERAAEHGRIDAAEHARLERVIGRLDAFVPRRPKPALLHGDLWSGNALATLARDGSTRIAVIDPACSIGDGWADIAMMRLFGGFPDACFDAYRAAVAPADDLGRRLDVYGLYHLLNHLNLFGLGYAAQVFAVVRRLEEDV